MFEGKIVKLIWAENLDCVIGVDNKLPWNLPEDLAHFKKLTLGEPVIMGWNTWMSLPDKVRPLPGRENIVLTRDSHKTISHSKAVTAQSLEEGIRSTESNTVWVIGGATVYEQALPYADEVHVTIVDIPVSNGDAFAPDIYSLELSQAGDWQTSTHTGIGYKFNVYKPV